MNYEEFVTIVGNSCYGAQAIVALWGVYCLVMVWRRIAQKRFRNEDAQLEFLQTIEEPLERGDFDAVGNLCEGDPRVVPQLTLLAVANRTIGFSKVKQLIADRFQRDLMADLEYRVSWVNMVIKSEPMLGLFGTVLGMMGAFAKLAAAESVKPTDLANDISVALITTAIGLAVAIPLGICMAAVNVRIRKMEDLAVAGLTRVMESLRAGLETRSKRGG